MSKHAGELKTAAARVVQKRKDFNPFMDHVDMPVVTGFTKEGKPVKIFVPKGVNPSKSNKFIKIRGNDGR